jgi:hypothetical protein
MKYLNVSWYALTRYYWVRALYGFIRGLGEGKKIKIDLTQNENIFEPSFFSSSLAAKQMRKESWTVLPDLSACSVRAIYEHSLAAKGRRPSFDKNEVVSYKDIVNGKLKSGDPAIMLRVDPDGCKVISDLKEDPVLMDLAESYLGYRPRDIEAQLLWSFHSVEMSLKERHKLAQAVFYHWDSMAVNGFRVNYYLTDVDEGSGAHVLIPKSHKQKPLKYLFARSTTINDQPLLDYYGEQKVIEGKAGSGFAQDVNGFHKALPPITADRLHLHIRYT